MEIFILTTLLAVRLRGTGRPEPAIVASHSRVAARHLTLDKLDLRVTGEMSNDACLINGQSNPADAPLTVEVLNHRAQPIPGYSAKVSTSGIQVPVVWSKPVTPGRKRALRVRYPVGSRAHVYAVNITGQNRSESAEKE
ncbi:MAG: hypothetical protein ACKVHE_16830 [Planctomycetales bacterium]|jgi:hypothetical protein